VLAGLSAAPAWSSRVDGVIKLGGITIEEDAGDLSAMQETYNIHDGFSLTQILLNGKLTDRDFFRVDLQEINLDARKAHLSYNIPRLVRLTARFDQHRQVYDSDRAVSSKRKDLRLGLRLTPIKNLRVTGNWATQMRDGARLSFPAGTVSRPGGKYDYTLNTGMFEANLQNDDGRGIALGYQLSRYADDLDDLVDRKGRVLSFRAYGNDFLLPTRVSHFLRASFGKQELNNAGFEYKLSTFQYTGVYRPDWRFNVKYRFDGSSLDNSSTDLKTDNVRNNFDMTYFHEYGRVSGGYGYETNDDDGTLTAAHLWRVGGALGYRKWVKTRASYESRVKEDQEKRTLLRDAEMTRFRVSVESQPLQDITIGASYVGREREYPDIDVESEGEAVNVFGTATMEGWGSLTADYTYSRDEYDDLAAGFDTESNTVTGRLDIDYVKNLRFTTGLTYMDIGKDLDIEKSIVFFEGEYTLRDTYLLEFKYNIYSYDDYVVLNRYYTADVIWINVGYKFSAE
jgi:hypothetical protein